MIYGKIEAGQEQRLRNVFHIYPETHEKDIYFK